MGKMISKQGFEQGKESTESKRKLSFLDEQ
jgi:hypothetical protein